MTTYTPKKLPDPGAVALLGTVLLLDVKEPDERVVRHEWDQDTGPALLWSVTSKALYFFPGVTFYDLVDLMPRRGGPLLREHQLDMKETVENLDRAGVDVHPDTQKAARLFRKFYARPATQFTNRLVNPVPLRYAGSGVKIDYRSDKWNGRNGRRVNYTHAMTQTETDRVSVAGRGTTTRPPNTFFIKGPALTVNERGIIW